MKLKGLRAVVDKLTNGLAGKEVQVGYFEGINYEDGTPVAYVATIHEFGAPSQKIPPRPTMRPTIAENQDHYTKQLGAAAKVVMDGKMNGGDALDLIGKEVAADIQKSISQLDSPVLSPITLMLRKMKDKDANLKITGKIVGEAAAKVAKGDSYSGVSTKPLNDTGIMYASVQSAVVEK